MGKTSGVYGRAPPEVRIAYEVAMDLRILPRFSDDGAPEGTVERCLNFDNLAIEPTAVGAVAQHVEVVAADELVEVGEFVDVDEYGDEDEVELFLEEFV